MFQRFLILALLSCSISLRAQTINLSGQINGGPASEPVPDAYVTLLLPSGKSLNAVSEKNGSFSFTSLSAGQHIIVVSCIGFKTYADTLQLTASKNIQVMLSGRFLLKDEVIVRAIRAQDKSAGTFTNISKGRLEEQNMGQDFPFLLNMTPSVVVNSDAGAGVGYTGMTIRGIDQTRINVTINGIPVNDAESQGVYWVDLPDFASSVQSVQIQRGVGTSTNGAAAFGSSINVQTNSARQDAYAELNSSVGSFNTYKNNVQFGTGILKNGWSFDGRLSKLSSDGYIDRAFSDLKSYYLSAGHYGKKSMIKLVHFSGAERTYQAWNGIAQDVLDTNRTYNEFTYPNQTDNYQQDYYQAFFTYEFNKKLLLNTALFYTRGKGYYEEYKTYESFSDYGLTDVVVGTDTILQTDLIRRRWLDNDFYGTTFSLQYSPSKKTTAILGGGATYYDGRHYGEIIWAQYAATVPVNTHYYHDNSYKTDVNVYGKVNHSLGKVTLFGDAQVRYIQYNFLGFDQNLSNIQQTADYTFFNPKAGAVYAFSDSSDVYVSYSVAGKEPNRNDFVNSTMASRPKAEHLQDIEMGYRKTWKRASVSANVYYMHYQNQLILSGKINDVGAYNRINVPVSYRTGIELAGSVTITTYLQWSGNLTVSENKIKKFTEYVDDWDWGGQWTQEHRYSNLAFSPEVIASSQIRVLPFKSLYMDLMSKYVSDQYLDNTQNNGRKLDAFFVNNLLLSYSKSFSKGIKNLRLGLMCNNLFNEKYEPNGYTYSGISGGVRSDYNYYFPQACRNYLMQVTLGF